jgi:hypothetical protein
MTDSTKATDHPMTTNSPLPGRRQFLRVGGASVGLAALAAACVNTREATQVAQTGTRVPAPSTSVPPFPGSPVLDARLALTAVSVEKLAVDTYRDVLDNGWIGDAATVELVRKIQDRHRRHTDLATAQAAALGQDGAGAQTNAKVKEDLVAPGIETVQGVAGDKRQAQIEGLKVLSSVEDALAQLYTKAAGEMTTPALRQWAVALGTATARQYTAVASKSEQPLVPFSFQPANPTMIPEDSYVAANESRLPAAAGTTSTTRR